MRCLHLVLVLLCASVNTVLAQAVTINSIQQQLKGEWKLRNMLDDSWMDAVVPGSVMYTLHVYKKIPHPYYANNEKQVQWVDTAEWQYGLYFDIEPDLYKKKNIDLVLEGLDTYCSIFVNGTEIQQCDNQFRTWRIRLKTILLQPERNYLTINFKSTTKVLDSLSKNCVLKLPTDNRAFARKSAMSFGWDFAPKLLSAGILGDIKLQGYDVLDSRILKLYSATPIAQFDVQKFQFKRDEQVVFIKGVNIVPPRVFEPITNGVIDKMLRRPWRKHDTCVGRW
jgi:beta-mannosidase